jgi:hypothetical protein
MRKRYLLMGALVILAVAGLVVALSRAPGAASIVASANFLGYTNDAIAGRLAVFKITNHASIPIDVMGTVYCDIDSPAVHRSAIQPAVFTQTGAGWTNPPSWAVVGRGYVRGLAIGRQGSQLLAVTAPAISNRWRLSFPYEKHQSQISRLAGKALTQLQKLGIPAKNRAHSYASWSEEIAP